MCRAFFEAHSKIPETAKYTVSGVVREAGTGENMIGATVFVQELNIGTTTNQYGFYSLTLEPGIYHLIFRSFGFQTEKKLVLVETNTKLNVSLVNTDTELEEVVISGETSDRNISSSQMSVERIEMKTIKKMPSLMGETDIIRSIQLLPGVSTVGEGAPGFNVRGGNVDQNLVLLDGAPIFNTSHLFGFFSTFNPDIIRDVTLYKGGIPAQFGGRIASVLDLKFKEGNSKQLSGQGGIGPIASRFCLEGPIKNEKTTFVIAGRGSWADPYLRLIPDKNVQNSKAYFYDANFKISHRFNTKNALYLSAYLSRDRFKFPADTAYEWGNASAVLRWNHLFNDKLFANVTAAFTNYTYGIEGTKAANEFEWQAGIVYKNLKTQFTYYPSVRHQLEFGADVIQYSIKNGTLKPLKNSPINPLNLQQDNSLETALFVNEEFKISSRINLSLGIRYSAFFLLGSGEVYQYQSGVPKSRTTITDTLNFASNELIQTYQGFEPRMALNYVINSEQAVKLSFNRMRQYLHLISNTTAITPVDIWKNSNTHLTPQVGDQLAVGYFRNMKDNTYETSVELYYKKLTGIIDYKEGADLILNPTLETELLAGTGKAYGIEMMLRKNKGKLTGWVSYTYARSLRTVAGTTFEERINDGNPYPTNFDIPHNLKIFGSVQFTKRTYFSFNFLYNTGRPITYPNARYDIGGVAIPNYISRNQQRIPDYHRMDITLTADGKIKPDRKWQGSWVLAVYNVYGRRNAYSIFFKPDFGVVPNSYRLSVLGSALPSLTYNFKF
ncbi:MAG: TonB-dependent receptor [Verrucomicrobia bacterium]|nr:TonB-dependent receptor [Cytophagales bacterium]